MSCVGNNLVGPGEKDSLSRFQYVDIKVRVFVDNKVWKVLEYIPGRIFFVTVFDKRKWVYMDKNEILCHNWREVSINIQGYLIIIITNKWSRAGLKWVSWVWSNSIQFDSVWLSSMKFAFICWKLLKFNCGIYSILKYM